MLDSGHIYLDPDLSKDRTNALTVSIPGYTTTDNVSINLNPSLFKDGYLINGSRHPASSNWENDADLSITLYHEYQHAFNQGSTWQFVHPNEKEDRAYAAAQQYIAALRNRNLMNIPPLWYDAMYDQHVTPDKER